MTLLSDRIDGIQASAAIKVTCRAATTANITLSGEQTIDGVAVSENGSGTAPDRILVKDQTNTVENGIYDVSTSGWTRAKDFDGARDVVQGTLVPVYAGTVNGRTTWQCTTANPVRPGTSNITFEVVVDVDLAGDLSNTTDALLGDYLVGTKRTGTGAVAMRLHYWIETQTYNVKDFVDPTVATTDWTAAINLAYARIPATGGILEFPEGDFAFDTALSFTNAKPFIIKGQGNHATRLRPTFSAGNALTVDGAGYCRIMELSVFPTVNRASGTYNIKIMNCTFPSATNVFMSNTVGGLWMFEACNFLNFEGNQGNSYNSLTQGDTCLRVKSCGGTITNNYFRSAAAGQGPCFWFSGQSTSMKISTNGFAGGGPRSTFPTLSGSASAGAFTITVASHDFQVGDYLVVRGVTPSAYNNMWIVNSVTSTTITVNTSDGVTDVGTLTVNGTVESVSSCAYITNEDGAVNESSIDGVLFEAMQANIYGTAGLYFDGRRGTVNAKAAISGWQIGGSNYYDYGATGLLISGDKANSSNEGTVTGFVVDNPLCSSNNRGILIDQAQGVIVTGGLIAQVPSALADDVGYLRTQGILIRAGTYAPYTQGVIINGVQSGSPRGYSPVSTSIFDDGLALALPGMQDITVSDCTLFGGGQSINEYGAPTVASSRFRFNNNNLNYVTYPLANTNYIPSVASGTTIFIFPFNDIQKITGTTNIQTISPARIGQELRLIFPSALSLVTGGNLAIAANLSVLAGQVIDLIYDGTSWYVK